MCIVAIEIKILALGAKKAEFFLSLCLEAFSSNFRVVHTTFHTTLKGLQLPFQNGMATFCSLTRLKVLKVVKEVS